jgi:hypothetical protein
MKVILMNLSAFINFYARWKDFKDTKMREAFRHIKKRELLKSLHMARFRWKVLSLI